MGIRDAPGPGIGSLIKEKRVNLKKTSIAHQKKKNKNYKQILVLY